MPPGQGENWKETWKRDRIEQEQALADLENDADREEEALTLDEQLERSRNAPRNDPDSRCAVHHRSLSLPEWTRGVCNWCLHGGREGYAAYLDSQNLDRNGRPKRVTSVKEIA